MRKHYRICLEQGCISMFLIQAVSSGIMLIHVSKSNFAYFAWCFKMRIVKHENFTE